MKNVMVVIDESNSSYDLLIWVLQNLKDTIQSSKVLIFATQPQNFSTTPISVSSPMASAQILYPFSPNAELTRLAQEKNMKIASGILEKAKKICGDLGIKAETLTYTGGLKGRICKIIQERDISLVVMSNQQTRDLKRYLHNIDCSLLVLKKGFR